MNDTTHILFCDDDPQFAASCAAAIQLRVAENDQFPPGSCTVHPLSNLSQLKKIATDPAAARKWHAIICDLGWGDLTLEGIQILHDMQMHNPHMMTVLYTAQENLSVHQTLEWKLHFIDRVLKVDSGGFHQQVCDIVCTLLQERSARVISHVAFSGVHLLPSAQREMCMERIAVELHRLQRHLAAIDPAVAAEVLLTSDEMRVKFKVSPVLQKQKTVSELIATLQKFPRVEPHDLVPLAKAAYIAFIQERYGGFPQMAAERGLDLNHLYRVNRRFKNAPFVVFKFAIVQEIVGINDPEKSLAEIRPLLCPVRIVQKGL